MKAQKNAAVNTCLENLLSLTTGEVHLDQLRGLDASLIDRPSAVVLPFLQASAFRTVEAYEPRATFADLTLTPAAPAAGDFTATLTPTA